MKYIIIFEIIYKSYIKTIKIMYEVVNESLQLILQSEI